MPKSKKTAIRKIAKNRRSELARHLPDAGGDLFKNFPFTPSENHVIGGYLPIGSEIDPRPLMRELAARGARLCLPRTSTITKAINFHSYKDGDELEKGPMGIFEPKIGAQVLYPNVILVPFLAFDENGFRLGYGGGYYDRAIASLRKNGKIITIGIGYDGQKLDNLPIEPHDERLDFILTECSLHNFMETIGA